MIRFLAVVFLWAGSAGAGNLSAPFSFESANVLPKGIRNITNAGFTTEAFNKYNTDGNSEAIGQALNKNLTWQDIINGQDTVAQGQSIQAILIELGKNLNEVVGSTAGVVNARAVVNAPILAYGITSRWTAAVAVPIVYANINVDTGFISEQVLEDFVGNELVAQGLAAQAEVAAAKFVNLVNQKAVTNGYEPISGGSKTMIGDVKLVNKFQLEKNESFALAVKGDVTFPTGETADPHKVVDIGSGDGQWDVGAGAVLDYYATPYLTLTAHANYTLQLSDNVVRHLPKSSAEKLSADVDGDVYRDLGDLWGFGLTGKLTFLEAWTFASGYQYQWKNADEYIGNQFEAFRYEILAFDTHQQMHSLQIGLEYSTLPMFRKKKFPLPLQAAAGYTWVIAGENVNLDPVIGFRVSAFF